MKIGWRVVAVFVAFIVPIYGQQQSPKSSKQQKAAQQPVTPDGQAPQTVIYAINQNGSDKNGDGAEQHPKSYFSRLFSPENLPNIALVFVGAVGVCFALRTLRAIQKQAVIMERQI